VNSPGKPQPVRNQELSCNYSKTKRHVQCLCVVMRAGPKNGRLPDIAVRKGGTRVMA
jgi:hypothetical protein